MLVDKLAQEPIRESSSGSRRARAIKTILGYRGSNDSAGLFGVKRAAVILGSCITLAGFEVPFT